MSIPAGGLRPSSRVVRERWSGAAFNVKVEHHDPPLGDITVLELQHIGPDGRPALIIEVLLDDASRRTLAQALAGGIVIAHPTVNGAPGG